MAEALSRHLGQLGLSSRAYLLDEDEEEGDEEADPGDYLGEPQGE